MNNGTILTDKERMYELLNEQKIESTVCSLFMSQLQSMTSLKLN